MFWEFNRTNHRIWTVKRNESLNVENLSNSIAGFSSDTGFFSIQVLQKALETFNIELIPFASQQPMAQHARDEPTSVQAYICNLREHWLTIRRFGRQYFDLNSISNVPKLISDTYLSLYLAQLQQSGYSIFIIRGDLPVCLADERLANNVIDPTFYRSLTEQRAETSSSRPSVPSSSSSFDDSDLQRAIKASVEMDTAADKALQQVLAQSLQEAPNDDELVQQAIAASLINNPIEQEKPSVEELRQRRLDYFKNKDKDTTAE